MCFVILMFPFCLLFFGWFVFATCFRFAGWFWDLCSFCGDFVYCGTGLAFLSLLLREFVIVLFGICLFDICFLWLRWC